MTATILPFPSLAPAAPPAELVLPPDLPAPRRAKAPLTPRPLARPPRALNATEAALQARILEGFFQGYRPAQNHEPDSIRRDRAYVERFLAFVGQPLWAMTDADFESWAAHLGLEKLLAARSQRTMQIAVAQFWAYAVENAEWQNEVARQFGSRIQPIVTRGNRVVHTCDNTPVRERKYLVADEFDDLFALLDCVVEVAAQEAPRLLKTFQRDRAMFYTYYAFGLRLGEGHGLNVHSFSPNPDLPELGRFGCVGVLGKGCRGSGKRFRLVATLQPDIGPLLSWYVDEIRPKFLRNAPSGETAMWLSEQGKRLCRASISLRYKTLLDACGQNVALFAPHGLRHMYVSHQACANVPTLFTSRSAGHSNPAVTARYTHLPDDYQRTVAFNVVRASLAAAKPSKGRDDE